MTQSREPIHAPRGTQRSCKSWATEGAMRMLMNNLDPEVAEHPDQLIVYGGSGRAARSWDAYAAIIATLQDLEDDETLLVQSGKPVGVLRTHEWAPRVLIANSNLVPQWATWEEFRRRVAAAVAGERWVIDGNYTSQVKDLVWACADTVVWLDLPRRTVMRRIIWRSFRRAAARTELWNGNRERWRNFFSLDKEESVIAWAWQTHAATRAKMEAAVADQANSHVSFVRLENPGAVRRFLQDLRR